MTDIYAGVVEYTSGTVLWDLAWAETTAGIAPELIIVAAGKVGVRFVDPAEGGAIGTATLTATVDGIPANDELTATVVVTESTSIPIGWFDAITWEGSTASVLAEGDDGGYQYNNIYYAGIVAPVPAGPYQWTMEWEPINPAHQEFTPELPASYITYDEFDEEVITPMGLTEPVIGITPQWYWGDTGRAPYPGVVTLTCTVDGVPCEGTLTIVFALDADDYWVLASVYSRA